MKIMDIIGYIGTALGFVIAFISFISARKKDGNIDNLKSGLKETKNIIELIKNIIPKAIKTAEESGGSGTIKKLIAVSQIVMECAKLGVDYNNYASFIDEELENQVKLTNEVNVQKIEVKKEV
jgi:hypothetical protein